MLRSIGAIAFGFILIGALSFGADAVQRQTFAGAYAADGRVDSVAMLTLALAYVFVFAVVGCYLTARLAPDRPMRHALILGALGLAFNIAGTITLWHTAPAWYHIVALAMVMPAAWLGGRLREMQLERGGMRVAATA